MQTPITFTLAQLWADMLAVAGAIVAISAAVAVLAKVVAKFKKPNTDQNKRLDALEAWRKDADGYFKADKQRLDGIEAGNRVTQQAILALLDHSIDGNNIEQMQDAKVDLQKYLISGR